MVSDILRPNSDYSISLHSTSYYHNQCVDDVTPDEALTIVYWTGGDAYGDAVELYGLELPDVSYGVIDDVKIYIRCIKLLSFSQAKFYTAIRTHGTIYYGSEISPATSYTTYNTTYTTNPNTGNAWTWAEINDLKAGFKLNTAAPCAGASVTQVYVVVTFHKLPSFGPEVATINISCDVLSPSIYILRPVADGPHLGLLHTLMLDNWDCVDEEVCDNNTSMVWNDYTEEEYDLYEVEDISIPSDYIINSISVVGKGLIAPSYDSDLIYKLIIKDPSEVSYSESDNLRVSANPTISGTFGDVRFAWAENPYTNDSWTVDEINNLQIGILKKSKIYGYDNNTYCWLDGSADGSTLELTPVGTSNHYEAILNEGNYSTIYIRNNTTSTWQTDLIEMEHEYDTDNGYPPYFDLSPNIDRVRLYIETYKELVVGTCKAKLCCKTHGITYYGTEKTMTQGQDAIAINWYTNPHTGLAWTWDEVLAAEFGIALYSTDGSNYLRVYEGELLVIYDKALTHTLATSQLYLRLNISVPETLTTKLPSPSRIENVNHNINTNALNFASGNRAVYSMDRNDKKIILSGLMWDGCVDGYTSCADIINNLKTIMKYKEPVNITGLRYASFNTEYNIIAFNPIQISEEPVVYEWSMILEFTE